MTDLGPLALMFSWQALLCAIACVGITKLPTMIIDRLMGKAKRQANWWLTHLLYPMIPILIGILYATLVPLRPEVLTEYVTKSTEGLWQLVAYAAWGGACGQFSQVIYDKMIRPVLSKP